MKNAFTAKTIVLLFLLLAVAGVAKAQQWKELHTGITEDLYSVCCIDTNTVFVCGQNGVILKTEDGGENWQEKYRQSGCQWYKIKFVDSNIGFVLGHDDNNNNSKLFKTIDGGDTWLNMGDPFSTYNATSPYSCDLFLVDSDTLYIACDQLMKSIDGGNSFSQLEIGWLYDTQDLYFEDNVGYIVWGQIGDFQGTHIAKTMDYGSSWEEILAFDSDYEGIKKTLFHDKDHVSIYGAFGYDDNEGYYEYDEIRTNDGFATYQWLQNENLPIGNLPFISGVCFSDPQNGIIVYRWEDFSYPYSGIFMYQTQDGGNTWLELETFDGPDIGYPAIDVHEGVYYLAMGNGRVYKLKGDYDGVVEEKENVFVFPNPSSAMVHIEGIEVDEIQVFNMLGQKVKTVKGSNEINMENMAEGVYLLKVRDKEGMIHTGKVMKKSK